MNFKYEFVLALLCGCVHLGLTVEMTVTCKIISIDFCFIDTPIELQLNDTLKFNVTDAETIKELDIGQDSKLVTIPPGIFETFPALEKLFVADLGISVLLADRFEGAKNLLILNIYNNNISVVPSKVFVNLPNTKEILLSSSNIETIEDNAFDGMMNLDELRLEENRIKTLRRLSFAGAPNIKTLSLRSNEIDAIEEGALNLPNLENLYLNNNQLTMLSDTLLIGAPNLCRAFFDQNKIARIGKAFIDCDKLKDLSLNNYPIEDIILPSIATVKNLNILFLENIKLELPHEIPEATRTESKLKKIWLTGNNLSNPNILSHLSVFGQLEEIFLMGNNFTVLNDVDKIRNYFPEIKRLGLASNEPSLCDWIKGNEEFLKDISVWGSTSHGRCQSADYKADQTLWRN